MQVNDSKWSQKCQIHYKFGVKVLDTKKEVVQSDLDNGHTLWQDAASLEIQQLQEYDSFCPVCIAGSVPDGYTKISVQFVFDVKEDGH